jgi:hypothetical protein
MNIEEIRNDKTSKKKKKIPASMTQTIFNFEIQKISNFVTSKNFELSHFKLFNPTLKYYREKMNFNQINEICGPNDNMSC